MHLLLPAVLLAFLQVAPTSTPQADKSSPPTQSRSDVQSGTPSDTGPYTVNVGRIPAATVNAPKPDWVDWGYWVFSGLLVVVGGFQAFLLWRTLGAINDQAELMKRQAKATEDAVTATRDNAIAAKDGAEAAKANAEAAKASADVLFNSERAWIDGELIRETFPAVRYRLKITNHGKTPARMLGFEIDCGCLSEGTEFSRERFSNRSAGKLHFLLGADKSRMLEEVEPLNMHVIFGGCLGAGAYCVTIRYADVVAEDRKSQIRETSFIYYCRFLLDSLERISDYDKHT
jgi:hypothetical protein